MKAHRPRTGSKQHETSYSSVYSSAKPKSYMAKQQGRSGESSRKKQRRGVAGFRHLNNHKIGYLSQNKKQSRVNSKKKEKGSRYSEIKRKLNFSSQNKKSKLKSLVGKYEMGVNFRSTSLDNSYVSLDSDPS
jgi:hypothetical protein